jgi:hypothetical protein
VVQKLIRHGSGFALVIDKEILKMPYITGDSPFELSADGKNIILPPEIPLPTRRIFLSNSRNGRPKNRWRSRAEQFPRLETAGGRSLRGAVNGRIIYADKYALPLINRTEPCSGHAGTTPDKRGCGLSIFP